MQRLPLPPLPPSWRQILCMSDAAVSCRRWSRSTRVLTESWIIDPRHSVWRSRWQRRGDFCGQAEAAKRVVPAVPPPQGRPPLPLLRSLPRGQDCGEGTKIVHGIFHWTARVPRYSVLAAHRHFHTKFGEKASFLYNWRTEGVNDAVFTPKNKHDMAS